MNIGDFDFWHNLERIPREKDTMHKMFKFYMEAMESRPNPPIYYGDLDPDLMKREHLEPIIDVTNYYFPERPEIPINYGIVKMDREYSEIPIRDEREYPFPRPSFLEKIWFHKDITKNDFLSLAINPEDFPMLPLSRAADVAELMRTPPYDHIDVSSCRFIVSYSQKTSERYVDLVSPRGDIAFGIPYCMEKELELERELERYVRTERPKPRRMDYVLQLERDLHLTGLEQENEQDMEMDDDMYF